MRVVALFFAAILVISTMTSVQAQVPNAGFENWTLGNPDGWGAPNLPGVDTLVSPTTDRHSGSLALRGEVRSVFGFPISPTVATVEDTIAGFPVGQRYLSLTGWYKLSAIGDDRLFVTVVMYNAAGDTGVGAGVGVFAATGSFSQFTVPIQYDVSGTTPGRCIIQMTIISADTLSGLPHPGTSYIADDLALGGATSVGDGGATPLPQTLVLMQNYPNPFNPVTTITFVVPPSDQQPETRLEVFDVTGRKVATLVDGRVTPGTHTVRFDGTGLASGTYLVSLRSAGSATTRMMMLIR
jgi:hypothetical protein